MFISASLLKTDPKVFELTQKELERQQHELELIPSENYASKAVLEAMSSVFANKYAEGYVGKRYYGGQVYVDQVEQLAIDRAKKLFGAEHVNVQSLSGAIANIAVFFALLNPGDTILAMALDQGGHLSHGHPLNISGKWFNIVPYMVDPTTHVLDMAEVRRLAHEVKPKLILAGFSSYPRNLDWKEFSDIAKEVGAISMADIAHVAGLIAGGALESPVPHFDIVTTTTHKTLRGPRGAMIMCKESFAKDIDRAVFPGIQGGPHIHQIAAKAVCFEEASRDEFRAYAQSTILNAKTLATELQAQGCKLVTDGTDNHMVLIDVSSFDLSGKAAQDALEMAGLSVNKNVIPYDARKPQDPSGIRIGTPAVTTRGMGTAEMTLIADIIVRALKNHADDHMLLDLKNEVRELALRFPIYS